MKGLEDNNYFVLSTESQRIFFKYNREYRIFNEKHRLSFKMNEGEMTKDLNFILNYLIGVINSKHLLDRFRCKYTIFHS